ncbi:hypothetical protein [Caballeronia sp. LZ016]|uniref:hypothetical protein n=1 Tax=Caballeronia sp. LZ016 TaxID=3038554 RepID=UPI00285647A9|nr:hypothetical protein [Caballeronia sp. LZ016]MDR5738892.1 hypothetical protein [Caballeronia sp. LZ016]
MEDIFEFDIAVRDSRVSAGAARSARGGRTRPPGDGKELAAGEAIDIYHWAAVALVTALMCAVLGYAAGTPALARAANVTSLVFGVAGGMLTASGIVRRLRARLTATGAHEPLTVSVAETR